ncbi:MAG TPA: amidase family protein, partial [Candidatus Nanopelagicales bacterium]|nr:amidase family protein [Candidatus Nanopelagicales bacterium]
MEQAIEGALLLEASVSDVHALYERRALRPSELVSFHLKRVGQLDLDTDTGVPFNSILTVDPQLVDQAAAIDREIAGAGVTLPLQGIPVWIKDCIDVRGLPTMCGCLALEENVPDRDADLVAGLRSAGAIIMGKVGMTEFSIGTSPYSTASVRIGNSFDPRNPPGGSSSGSAVAVSLGFGTLAVGVDDCTSIVTPAALNGCVGMRPTVGAVPRNGLWSYSESDTSPGPMGRRVRDVAVMLDVLAGEGAAPGRELRPDALRGRRIGVLEAINDHALRGGLPAG